MDISAADNETVRPLKRQRTVAGVDTADATTNDDAKISCHVNENNNQLTNATNKDDGDTTTLPPECWAGIMNYLDYDSVLSCAATSKMILRDAMPLVTSLHIEKSSQLNGLSARFRDVQVLNILSLVHVREGNGDSMKVDDNTVMSLVPFLLHFRKLERAFLGGRDRDGDIVGFREHNHFYNNEDEQLIRNLMDQISNAFQRKFLPKNLCVQGLRCPESRTTFQGTSSCKHCQLACKTWPIQHVINFSNKGSSRVTKERSECIKPNRLDVCLTNAQIESLVDARPGGNDLLHSESRLMYQLSRGFLFEILSDDGKPFRIVIFSKQDFEEMKRIIDTAKLDVKKLSREDVMNATMRSFTKDGDGQIPPKSRCHLTRYVFKKLTSLGFQVHEEDWYLLKTTKQNLPQIIKGLKSSSSGIVQSNCLYLFKKSIGKEQGFSLIQPSIDLGVVPLLAQFLKPDHSSSDITRSANALQRIANKSAIGRDKILKPDIIAALCRLLEHRSVNVQESVSKLIRDLCQGNSNPDFSLKSCAKPLSRLLLNGNDDKVLMSSSMALFELSSSEVGAKAVVESGVYPRLVQLLGHSSKEVQSYALAAISNLTRVDKSLIQPLIKNESFSILTASISKVDSRSVDFLAESAVAVLFHLCQGREHIRTAVSQGCLQSLSNVLSLNDIGTDTQSSYALNKMIVLALRGLLMVSLYCKYLPSIAITKLSPHIDSFIHRYWSLGERKKTNLS